jgi:beta-N-acetylhexosaminidase
VKAAALLVTLFLLVPSFCFSQALHFSSPGDPEILAASLVEQLSDEEALAQTMMFGWAGEQPSPLILQWIRERRIGGVKVFGWNARNITALAGAVGAMQREAAASPLGIPLLVATDQEGGIVRHVKGQTSDTPGNMAIGASSYPEDAYRSGYYIGKELALLGINMNFAPVIDLATRRDSALIGPRSFGGDPVKAGILGAAFSKGQAAAGIISTAKHFPGHGGTSLDSHGTLPSIDADEQTLWDRELAPYRIMAKDELPAIMSGHLAFPNTPAGNEPASLSSWFLTDVLRKKIRYRGMVITDDLLMYGAVIAGGSLANTAKEAIAAGNDMILVSSTPEMYSQLWTYLAYSMRNDAAFRDRVREAARRVIYCKLKYLRGGRAVPLIPDIAKVRSGIPDSEGSKFFLEMAARSVTLVHAEKGALPLAAPGRVLLAGQYAEFFAAGRRAFPGAGSYSFGDTGSAASLRSIAASYDTVIFCLGDDEGKRLLDAVKGLGKKVIVMSVLNPVYLDGTEWADASVAIYSYAEESFIAGFSALVGRIEIQGKMP